MSKVNGNLKKVTTENDTRHEGRGEDSDAHGVRLSYGETGR